ncbi:bifunctional proline dehydrogenase/L-glutamate gamma-semialdehyde dehydrogenase PutA [Hansschlegelia zhihuaiae]|uniref:bifunctional proline dehydrogenase/L-glutamate gamma-semialdehyde dehydrogenase PutA n=1 Tax=Hansschlegelia zhihuaiae TaxID=405005 RepID=UPI001FDF7B53|nr:bifunctional proline dehydrogenase/L-glutamate gamma-semialdehyde dehydrogenase PutA [Hansschlegelia zhihuaiae]
MNRQDLFADLAAEVPPRSVLRAAVTAATYRPEPDCLPPLIEAATLAPAQAASARALATRLVETLRAKGPGAGVGGLIQEYDLSSQEGVALMCLAEALLRIPDHETRDALIRDKIAGGDWRSHLGHSPSLFVNAATWGLMITGRLTSAGRETELTSALGRLIRRGGEPLIHAGVNFAMRLLGDQFVAGRTIEKAIAHGGRLERGGFRHSYDMLGEAAVTAEDAARYLASYQRAVEAIGAEARGATVVERAGVSIKLSALHPRYERAKRARVMAELYPRLLGLATLARRHGIGLNIDAEEQTRLEVSLDLLEALCAAPEMAGWDGVGFVVQAYGKRAPFVIDLVADLARRTGRRIMVRLVKGAYWDSEIGRAQTLGLPDFPVFTRKIHTDVSYLACARKMLDARDAIYPQFATHNATTLSAIHEMAGPDVPAETYEFQCLHGMGRPLYEEIIGADGLGRPCRIYSPVGPHETLLAYLVRRLLENGANSSFVNRVADEEVSLEALVADPVEAALRLSPPGWPHDAIRAPRDLFGAARQNSTGLDLADEAALAGIASDLRETASGRWFATPMLGEGVGRGGAPRDIVNPARRAETVGRVSEATPEEIEAAFRFAAAGAGTWGARPPADRASTLRRAADLIESAAAELYGLLVREAGKTFGAAVAEVREAVDFLRYYAAEAGGWQVESHEPLGTVVCISPWNFPLAIFTGQVAAALAAGNSVLAKPAGETPLIASRVIWLLREAGVLPTALQLLPGDGAVGAALVADARADGVLFTGSTEAARSIQRALARRLGRDGAPVPLVAETGGLNAMIVDSSALPEQSVADILASAFDSAGQRCSALRLLCVQEDVADHVLAMLKGAAAELEIGDPSRLSTDVGPVISEQAGKSIATYVEDMRNGGAPTWSGALGAGCASGTFVAPTIIEIARVADLKREVFGPVLHVLRYRRDSLDDLVGEIEALGYGLTFGLHTRIDETVERLAVRAPAGNLYVNRNMIGAVVGVQPFGGHGLSGTGPKAGGPLYLRRLVSRRPAPQGLAGGAPEAAEAFARWLVATGRPALGERCRALAARSPLGARVKLPGPVGESNTYELRPRGAVLCRARSEEALFLQIGAALATGNRVLVDTSPRLEAELARLAADLAAHVRIARLRSDGGAWAAALVEDERRTIRATLAEAAARKGPIASVHVAPRGGDEAIPIEFLLREVAISVNVAAAGGNASLMALDG